MPDNFELMDVSQKELEMLGEIQASVTARYLGKPKDIGLFSSLKSELEERCFEAGFNVIVSIEPTPDGNWVPVCSIIGRTSAVEFDPERAGSEGGIII